jgi:hypothetical protein
MKSFKQYILEQADPVGVLFHGNKILVGVEHGSPFRVTDSQLKRKINQHGRNHGYYYEGKPGVDIEQPGLGLKSVKDYKGGFDEIRLQQQKKSKSIRPHNLSLIFSNVDVNWNNGISDHFKSGTVFDGIHSWARSHFGDFVTKDHVSEFLKSASENTDRDFLNKAKKTTATGGKKFLQNIEKIAWPADWATKKRTTGPEKLVDSETKERDQHLIKNMPAGVYIIGGGHLNSIKKIIDQ